MQRCNNGDANMGVSTSNEDMSKLRSSAGEQRHLLILEQDESDADDMESSIVGSVIDISSHHCEDEIDNELWGDGMDDDWSDWGYTDLDQELMDRIYTKPPGCQADNLENATKDVVPTKTNRTSRSLESKPRQECEGESASKGFSAKSLRKLASSMRANLRRGQKTKTTCRENKEIARTLEQRSDKEKNMGGRRRWLFLRKGNVKQSVRQR